MVRARARAGEREREREGKELFQRGLFTRGTGGKRVNLLDVLAIFFFEKI